jgi:rRNA maturation RNase YbeY
VRIDVVFEDVDAFDIDRHSCEEWLSVLCETYKKNLGTVCIIFCSDAYLLEVNKTYLNHNYYTDIITFNYCEGNTINGDLFISIDRVKDNASVYEVDDHLELIRVIAHGILHLIGFNDKEKEEQVEMRNMEDHAMLIADNYRIV